MQALQGLPVSARAEALRILCRVEVDAAYADILLDRALSRRGLAVRDRALTTELVYGTLRWQRRLDWHLARVSRRPLAELDPWVRNLLRLTAYQLLLLDRIPARAAVHEAVELAKRLGHPGVAEFVNATLRALVRSGRELPAPLPEDPVAALAVRASFPDWLAVRWAARYGFAEAEALLAALNDRAPLTLRVNPLKADPETLRRALQGEGIEARPCRFAPDGLVAAGVPALDRLPALRAGWCVVQDEASILVGHLLAPEPGEAVADVCAAPGTKTTHLAGLMADRGRLLAFDPHPGRLGRVQEACRRLGVSIVECLEGEVARLAPAYPEACHRVLVDAPCSNLGVLRRNPEAKWRCREADLPALQVRQRVILEAAATMVRPGGVLVYATCSLEPEENEGVVEPFLAAHPAFAPAPPPPGFPAACVDARGTLRMLPHRHGSDGFTAVRLRRRG